MVASQVPEPECIHNQMDIARELRPKSVSK